MTNDSNNYIHIRSNLHIQILYLQKVLHEEITYVLVKVAIDLHHGLEASEVSFPEMDSIVGIPEANTTDPRQTDVNWGDSVNKRLELGFLKATDAIDDVSDWLIVAEVKKMKRGFWWVLRIDHY